MLTTTLTIIGIFFISLLPILFWGYTFSYIDESLINRKRFAFGMLAGMLSVLSIYYMDKIMLIANLDFLNIFALAYDFSSVPILFQFIIGISILSIILGVIYFLFGIFIHRFKNIVGIYIKNLFIFIFFVSVISVLIFMFNKISGPSFAIPVSGEIAFGNIVFDSFKLIVFYYFIVAFLEESSKHFNFLQSSVLSITSVKSGVLYAIFVALGFSFVENIIYLYREYSLSGFGADFLGLYFSRSIFSIMVHILSSTLIAYFFSKAYLKYRENNLSFPYLKVFLVGIILSVFFHLVFNVALSLGFTWIIFLYFIGSYLYVSSIFYRE